MARLGVVVLLGFGLSGCGQFVSYCEGDIAKSPDGKCSAYLVQDVSTKRAYAVVECIDWHYGPPYPNWNSVIARGARTPMEVHWVRDHVVEVTVNADATIETHQQTIQGRSYSVDVLLRRLPVGAGTLKGCRLSWFSRAI